MAVTKFLSRAMKFFISTGDAVGSTINLTTPFGDAATDTLTSTAHGLVNGDRIRFSALTGGAGLAVGTDYYVIASAANTFQVALTPGGAIVNFTSNITAGALAKITATFVQIKGLNSRTHSDSSVDAETTGDDSDGLNEHMVAERGESWTIAGHKLLDTATGDQDPGQEAVETLAREVGPASIGYFKVEYPGGAEELFAASAKLTRPSGGHNDPASWSVTLRQSGPSTFIPAA